MGFYDLTKDERARKVEQIHKKLLAHTTQNKTTELILFFSDQDTYIRKAAYQSMGKIFIQNEGLRSQIISVLEKLLREKNPNTRQTAINAAGEIGIRDFNIVVPFFDQALFDEHHSVRNAVIGSIKKMGEKNPAPVLGWSKNYLHHPDKEIRREICHGIELRGRTHPGDILPLLKELQHDQTARVRNTLIHVIGQISYKKGCLATVIKHLKKWTNKDLVAKAVEEIIDVHVRYKDFAILTRAEVEKYIQDTL
ncbi:MAG: HEAT repeat domain-containing protein [Chitinophagaceae bacterium]|nr:HEAT repeat domain-containing protein [Chitinophagaceae bacterium]